MWKNDNIAESGATPSRFWKWHAMHCRWHTVPLSTAHGLFLKTWKDNIMREKSDFRYTCYRKCYFFYTSRYAQNHVSKYIVYKKMQWLECTVVSGKLWTSKIGTLVPKSLPTPQLNKQQMYNIFSWNGSSGWTSIILHFSVLLLMLFI